MAKNAWAKGRQSCTHAIAVDKSTQELAKKLAFDAKIKMKDLVYESLKIYEKQKGITC